MRLGRLLAEAGHAVWGIRRRPAMDPPHPRVAHIQADLTSAEGLTLPQLPTWVVYAVGADRFTPEAYRAAYVEGLCRLADALARLDAPVERFCFISSTSVYPQQNGEWVDESSPVAGRHFGAQTLIEAEQRAFALPWRVTVARLGGIYGPGRIRLIEAVRAGTARRAGGQTTLLNLIHRDDAAGALAHLLQHADPPRLCNITDLEPVDRNALLCWIAERLGLPEPPWAEEEGTPEPARGGNRRVSCRLLRSWGFRHRWPTYREGYGPLLTEAASGGAAVE